MKLKAVVQVSNNPSEGKKAYLTKRVLVRAAGSAIRKASKEAMLKMGYVVLVDNGYVVKVNKDGSKEVLEKLPFLERPSKIVLG